MKYFYIIIQLYNEELKIINITTDYYYARRLIRKYRKNNNSIYVRKISYHNLLQISKPFVI